MKTVVAAFLILASATSQVLAASNDINKIVGGWVEKSVSCEALKDYSHELIMKIGPHTIDGYESSCRIRNVTTSGAKFEINSICEAEGKTMRQTTSFVLQKNGMLRGKYVTYKRCY